MNTLRNPGRRSLGAKLALAAALAGVPLLTTTHVDAHHAPSRADVAAVTTESVGVTSATTIPDDDAWRALVDATCAAWLPLVTTADPTPGDPATMMAYVQTFRDAYDAALGVGTIDLPAGPGRSAVERAAVDAAARDALDRAAVGAAAGDFAVTMDETGVFLRNVGSLASGFAAAGQSCGPADAAVAANAALNVSIVGPWQLEIGYGSVWVSQTDDRVARIDPDDGTLLASIPMPSQPIRSQPADGRMLVRTETDHVAIDTATNTVVATLPVADIGPNAGSSWAVDGAIWICDGTRLHRYNPTTLEPVAVVELDFECGQAYATPDVAIAKTYNPDPGESGAARAAFVDPLTNTVTSTVDLAGDAGSPVVLDDRVFFPPVLGSQATVVDRATWTVTATPDLGRLIDGGSQAAFDGTSIYIIADKPTGTIVVVDPTTYAITGELKAIATAPSLNSLAATPGVVWAVNNSGGLLQRFDTGASGADEPSGLLASTPPASTTVDEAASGPSDDELSAEIEAVLTDALTPGSIRWNSSGVDAPATAAVAAVRIPGRDDVLIAVGENIDGTPAEADAPFAVGGLTESMVRTVAFQMVDEGLLDPALTLDQWVPTLPNADRVTVQMVIDNETGWSDSAVIEPDPVLTDFERAWSLREAVELRATVMTALAEPGTSTDDGRTNETVLGLVVEEVGGHRWPSSSAIGSPARQGSTTPIFSTEATLRPAFGMASSTSAEHQWTRRPSTGRRM